MSLTAFLTAVGAVGAVIFAIFLLGRSSSKSRAAAKPSPLYRPRHDPLVNAMRGDQAKADELVNHELQRTPGISRSEARKRALERLMRNQR